MITFFSLNKEKIKLLSKTIRFLSRFCDLNYFAVNVYLTVGFLEVYVDDYYFS